MTSVDGSKSLMTTILKQTLCPWVHPNALCPRSIPLWAALASAQASQGSEQTGPLPLCSLIIDRLCSLLLCFYHPVEKQLLNFFSLKQSIFSRSFTLANGIRVKVRQKPEMCLRRKIYPLAFPGWHSGKESTCNAGDVGSIPV